MSTYYEMGRAGHHNCGHPNAGHLKPKIRIFNMIRKRTQTIYSEILYIGFGTIHILRKQRGWVGGEGQMLTFAYMLGGWVKANAYESKI